jgi:hypothetical protein
VPYLASVYKEYLYIKTFFISRAKILGNVDPALPLDDSPRISDERCRLLANFAWTQISEPDLGRWFLIFPGE